MTHPTSSETTFNDEELDALVERLRKTPLYDYDIEVSDLPIEAADAITTLRTQLATLQLHLDSTNDKLEIERALTDGAHRRAREAEEEAHACGAEREAWKTRADRAEAALAAQIEADAGIVDQMFYNPTTDADFSDDTNLNDWAGWATIGQLREWSSEAIRAQPHDRSALDRLMAEHEVRLREAREISEAEKIAIRNKALREAASIKVVSHDGLVQHEVHPMLQAAILAMIESVQPKESMQK